MHAEAHIRVQGLHVFYGPEQALKNVSVDIPRRRITAIIGPSGCGKSTLLRSFNRLIDLSDGARVTGRVIVEGRDVYAPGVDVTEIRRHMGLLSQRPHPLPMSIFDNVAYGPRLHGVRDRRELAAIVERHLRIAGLWDEVRERLHLPASRLSLGQQQRLCLARGLDPISSRRIEGIFLELKRDYTLVLVTHILRQARRLADYVVFLYMGELIEHGPAEEFFASPREELTREYVQGTIS